MRLDLNAVDAPHERIYLLGQVTRLLRGVLPNAAAVDAKAAPCGSEQLCIYSMYDDIGSSSGARYSILVEASSVGARQLYADSADDPTPGWTALWRANVEIEGTSAVVRRLVAAFDGAPPTAPLNRVIAPRHDGGRVRIRATG